MAGERTLPGLGLRAFWTVGSNNWEQQHDPDTRLLSILCQCRAKSRVTALPGAPTNGDIYVVPVGETDENKIAARDNGAWVLVTPSEGFLVWIEDTNEFVYWSGSAWTVLDTGGGGGGEVEEAPTDGNLYGRKDGAWLAFMDAEGIPVAPYGGARIRPSALQNYTVIGDYDQVRFDTADRDTGGFWSDVNPNRLTVPAGVTKVRLMAALKVDSADAIESNSFVFGRNGETQGDPGLSTIGLGGSGYANPGGVMISDVIDVEAGDYFELYYAASGSFSLNASRLQTWFAIEVIERTFTLPALNANFGDLLDVDMETVAPADGDIAIWSEAEGKWLPGTPSVLVPEAQTFEKPFKGAMARFDANKGIGSPTMPVLWDDVDYDTDGFWSAASPGRFTVPAGVTMVRLHCTMKPGAGSFTGTSGVPALVQFGKNGNTGFRGNGGIGIRTGYNNSSIPAVSPPIPVEEGDYFEVLWSTSQSGTLTFIAAESLFAIEVLETEEVV